MATIEVNGRSVKLDSEGYLVDPGDWEKDVADALAAKEKIVLTEDHFKVIQLIRDYYNKNKVMPTIRELTKAMAEALGENKGNNKYLNSLFPELPLKQAGRIAGLPQLAGCS